MGADYIYIYISFVTCLSLLDYSTNPQSIYKYLYPHILNNFIESIPLEWSGNRNRTQYFYFFRRVPHYHSNPFVTHNGFQREVGHMWIKIANDDQSFSYLLCLQLFSILFQLKYIVLRYF